MRILELPEIRQSLDYSDVIACMRAALIANSRGECETPMPMHLEILPVQAEVHMKSSYRRGGKYFALKIAASFPRNPERHLPAGNGMMLLSSAETGDPLAFLADCGHLTDVRTAAAAAMVARELGRGDAKLGILGTGIQARLQAELHAEVLPLKTIWLWGRTPQRTAACASDLRRMLPGVDVFAAPSPADVARETRLIVTTTASRTPLLHARDIEPDTHISAVGADTPGKQELDAAILRKSSLLLVDSLRQCETLGELQHAVDLKDRAIEIGRFCESAGPKPTAGVTVCDFTGLGVEDLYIAEYCFERALKHENSPV